MPDKPEITAIHTINETAHLHSVSAGVVVPLLQATVTGVIVAVIVGLGLHDFYVAVMAGATVTLLYWLFGQNLWRAQVRMVLRDILPDPDPAEPVIQVAQLSITEDKGGYKETQIVELPYLEQLPELAAGLLVGRPFSEDEWVGNGKLFTRDELRELRGRMLERGLLVMKNSKNPSQGYTLTRAGRAAMEYLANLSPTARALRESNFTPR